MASNMVIKVKYGDSLRRFNAQVNENDQLDLDMAALKEKVLSLFSLNSDADITLTYIDEDGDVVTLVDDDDLRDVMRQQLKFLRIDVQLKNDNNSGRSYARLSGSSTPSRSPLPIRSSIEQAPLPNIRAVANEVLKPVPEQLRAALLKLSHGSASMVASTSPAAANLVDSLSRIGLSFVNPDSLSQFAGGTSARNTSSASPKVLSAAAGPKSTELSPETNQEVPIANSVHGVKGNAGAVATVTPVRPRVDLNKPPAEFDSSEPSHVKSIPVAVPPGDDRKEKKQMEDDLNGKSISSEAPASSSVPVKHVKTGLCATPDGFKDPFNACPFSGMSLFNNNSVLPSAVHPIKRNHAEATSGIFHRGIRCDGCGVYPITGPRFKSKVKEDYDLCSICFAEMGNETDYMRIDRPMSFRHPRSFKGTHEQHPWTIPPAFPQIIRNCGSKSGRPKLDSRFVLDVNITDGTLMAPSTPFIKIWRMRNNGSLVWPQGSQLVWIGGDRFSESLTAEMEIPADGVPVDGELDVAVDFTAPEYPGRYISYWRMASTSGQKFGQRVWVLIQVDVSMTMSNAFSSSIPLDLPPFSSGTKRPQAKGANVHTDMECNLSKPLSSCGVSESERPIDEQQKENEELNFPIDESLLVGRGVSASPVTESLPPFSYPMIDFTKEPSNVFFEPVPAAPAPASAPALVPVPVPVPATFPQPSLAVNATLPSPVNKASLPTNVDATSFAEGSSSKNVFEEALLKELEEMGFKQVDLNKEILRMNKYNLELSVDDLCGVAEWDPLLEELEEMGFRDTETNKKLLAKNSGSIKKVVMDLVNGEKKDA